MLFRLKIFSVLCALATVSCVTTEDSRKHGTQIEWFDGTVEEAFHQAQELQKPVFLYWGAVWCPPCNDLKDQVFSTVEFAEMTRQVIPVYLDGDSEVAQQWGERFKTFGYPTVLLMNSDQKELMRFGDGMNIHEFSDSFALALGSSGGREEALKRALAGQAKDADWRLLSFMRWEENPLDQNAKEFQQLSALFPKVPKRLADVRARFAAQLLYNLTSTIEANALAKKPQIRTQALAYIQAIFLNASSRFAARQYIVSQPEDFLKWLYPQKGAEFDELGRVWISAAKELSVRNDISIDEQLWTVFPEVAILKISTGSSVISQSLTNRVMNAVQVADRKARTDFQRTAVIPSAADLLGEVGEFQVARELVQSEIKKSKTPWYLYSVLASLEEKSGHPEAALRASRMAREAVAGRASRFQWIVSDANLNIRLKNHSNNDKIRELLDLSYGAGFSLPDGFSGRNLMRMRSLSRSIKPLLSENEFSSRILHWSGKCGDLDAEQKQRCMDYFSDLVKTSAK